MSVNTLIAQDKDFAYALYQSTELIPLKKSIKETWFPLPECKDNTHTSHIIAYARGLMSVTKAGAYATTDPALYNYSPYSIHNYLRKNCTDDINIDEGLDIVKIRGVALEKDFPTTGKCAVKPDRIVTKAAAENRIKDHLCILNESMAAEDKVLAVQRQLYKNNNSVIVQLNVQAHRHLPDGRHPVCVVGYNSDRSAFEVVSSKRWTDESYLWLPYEDFGQMALKGYVMASGEGTLPPLEIETPIAEEGNKPSRKVQPTPSPRPIAPIDDEIEPSQPVAQNTVNLHGTFEFRFVKQYDQHTDKPVFASASPILQGNTYILPDWKTGDVYQLLGTTMKAYSYTYVFSMDAEGKTEVHFPPLINMALHPDAKLNEPHRDLMTANKVPLKPTIVPDDAAYMVIPDEQSALQSVHSGKDYICVIYSHHELHDITERIVRVHEAAHRDFGQRLNEGFGDILMPNEDIRYTNDMMSFKAASDRGTAVPVVLEVQAN